MPIVSTGVKIALDQLSKSLASGAPGTVYVALNGAIVVGEIKTGESLGRNLRFIFQYMDLLGLMRALFRSPLLASVF